MRLSPRWEPGSGEGKLEPALNPRTGIPFPQGDGTAPGEELCHRAGARLLIPFRQKQPGLLRPFKWTELIRLISLGADEEALSHSWARSVTSGREAATSSQGQWPRPLAQLDLKGDIFLRLNYAGPSTGNGQPGWLVLFPPGTSPLRTAWAISPFSTARSSGRDDILLCYYSNVS